MNSVVLSAVLSTSCSRAATPGFTAPNYMSQLQFPGCTICLCMHMLIKNSCSTFWLITDSVYKDSHTNTHTLRL